VGSSASLEGSQPPPRVEQIELESRGPGLVAGLLDYGVESQVSTMLNTGSLKLAIGVISACGASTNSVWEWFIPRLGNTVWNVRGAHRDSGLASALDGSSTEVILVDSGVTVRPNSPIWQVQGLLLVVSLSRWRGCPPKNNWVCGTKTLSHREVGGVTDGVFVIHFARHRNTKGDVCFPRRAAAPAKLRHVLDPTVQGGSPCKIPEDSTQADSGQAGLLNWPKRFGLIEAPTVYSKTHWRKRKLSTKEMVAVLDLPLERLKGLPVGDLVQETLVPGKIRARVIDEVCEWIAPNLSEPKAQPPASSQPSTKRPRMDLKPLEKAPLSKLLDSGVASATVTDKASKADDAAVPVFLWDAQCCAGIDMTNRDRLEVIRAFGVLREKFLLPRWKRNVGRHFRSWIATMDESGGWRDAADRARSLEAGGKSLFYSSQASWWEWDAGSFPLFWRWQSEFMREIRDGMPPRFKHEPPSCMERQRPNRDPNFAKKERSKVLKVIRRGYLVVVALGLVRSLMHYFSVKKGEDDIRMVYDGSKCKLNAATFAPWFAVPTSSSLERTVLPHTVQADNDFADMFLNFQLHEEMKKYTGVDVTDLLNDEEAAEEIGRFTSAEDVYTVWDRPAMGLTASPYQAVQTATRGKRVMLGDRKDPKNPFAWDEVVLNAPGQADYDPTLPWIYKARGDTLIASDIHTYIDDNRSTANSSQGAWQASSKVAKVCAWLGMQDAARKRRAPSQAPGAWAGTVIRTDGTTVEKMVSQSRWDKTREKIRWIDRQLTNASQDEDLDSNCPKGHLPHKKLESIRGFLVYVSRTYQEFVPLLKGIHLTLDSWRKGRASSGWRKEVDIFDDEDFEGCHLTNAIDERLVPLEERLVDDQDPEAKPPSYVVAVPRLAQDLGTLLKLTETLEPPAVPVRPTAVIVGYLVGDASGAGHGSSFMITLERKLSLAHGTWGDKASKRSSNFRELGNLVRRVEQLVKRGQIPRGTELFIFTDNFVTESVFYKGAARSPHLHALVERLRMLQLHHGLFIHMLWIAGTRMIEQGSDDLSRGGFSSGVMAGRDFLSFLPLDSSALELSPGLESWVADTFPGRHKWTTLSAEGWYTDGHGDGHFIWAPPPALADAVLEQLCESVICRPWNAHVFICPAHMTYRWRKQLRKVADLVVTVPVGGSLWPAECHEPIVIALICPLLAYSPWRVKESERLAQGRGALPKMWSSDWSVEGDLLRKLWLDEVPSDTNLLWGLAPRVFRERPVRLLPSTGGARLG
jgi:hypothetical protein